MASRLIFQVAFPLLHLEEKLDPPEKPVPRGQQVPAVQVQLARLEKLDLLEKPVRLVQLVRQAKLAQLVRRGRRGRRVAPAAQVRLVL